MDAFFAAVEQRDNAEWRGQPLLVGGLHRGVVCAASYEARRFGVQSAMPMQSALRRCPQAIVVAPRARHYRAVSRDIFAIFARYTPLVEGLSIDEAFLDVTGSTALFGGAETIARGILDALRDELQLSASAGVAGCKFIAKIASDLRKPGGLVCVDDAAVTTFLAPLAVERLWGVGAQAARALRAAGIATIGDAAACPSALLQATLGRRLGAHVQALAAGIDPRPVIPHAAHKGMSVESTLPSDTADHEALRTLLLAQCLQLAGRLRAVGARAGVVILKRKTPQFVQRSRQRQLPAASDDPDVLFAAASALLAATEPGEAVRLIGVGVASLSHAAPAPQLFVDAAAQRRDRLESVRAQIEARFGPQRLTRASVLGLGR